jgi:hypothetical protein
MFGSRLIFGSHFPFRVAQLRDARERGGKLSVFRILRARKDAEKAPCAPRVQASRCQPPGKMHRCSRDEKPDPHASLL